MRTVTLGLGTTLALALGYLALWPIDARPEAWNPQPAAPLAGPLAPNDALVAVQRLDVGGRGPEDVAIGHDGRLYAGLEDGRIVSLPAEGGAPVTFARTGGRPLGLKFGPDGRLFVADARRGLLAVGQDGTVTVLSTSHGGRAYGLTDDLDVGADGTVYFTDATDRHPLGRDVESIVEHQPRGRLLACTPGGATRLIADGLQFANGVALAEDEGSVLVAETASYRVLSCELRARRGGCVVFADNLPGFPDGITRGERGVFWITLVSPRNALLDRLHPHPALKKALLRLPGWARPGPTAYGFVLGLDTKGRVVHNLQDPTGRAFAFVTNAVEHRGSLFLGSLSLPSVGRIRRP
jgi:sugar lactone lactonase YvrE